MPANRFIRYNNGGPYYEYDSSVAQDGSGPWLLLPIDASQITQGTFNSARIPSLPASIITTGLLALARGGTGVDLSAAGGTNKILAQDAAHVISARDLDAGDTVTGAFATARIPSLDASKTTTGIFGVGRIPDLDAAKIISGLLANARISTEGLWTPVIGGDGGTSGQTYSSQNGVYVKVGKLTIAIFAVALSAKGTITGNVIISGLPFPSENITGNAAPLLFGYFASLGVNWITLGGNVDAGASFAYVRGIKAAGVNSTTTLLTADITNSTTFVGAVFYRADS